MPRGLHANITTSLNDSGGVLYPAILLKLALDSGDVNIANTIGNVTYSGDTYTGVGNFGEIDSVQEPNGLSTPEIECRLNGVASDLISDALNEDYQNRLAYIYIAFLDSTFTL